jgi:hypothetical protein
MQGQGMLRRSKIFIDTALKIANSSVGAASNRALEYVSLVMRHIEASQHSENIMDVNLCVGLGHEICRSDGAYRNFYRGNYKDIAPPEHALALEMSKLQ